MDNTKIVLYTQTGLTIIVTGVWLYTIIAGIQTPALFDTIVGMIFGAYFTRNGKLLQDKANEILSRKRK